MSFRTVVRSAAAVLAVASAPAFAQNCAGFTDVTAANAFCPNVEWLKNRAITLGCSATAYCPTDPVSRLAMAAFMNRLGNALTPALIPPVFADTVSQVNLSSPTVVCQTGDLVVTGYPRRARFSGRVNLYNPSANGDFIAEMVYIDDGTTTWKAVQNSASYQAMAVNLTPINDVTTHPGSYLDLTVGLTYKFGQRVSRAPGTSANVAINCVNEIWVENRVVTATPFDNGLIYTAPADAPPPQGRALPRP